MSEEIVLHVQYLLDPSNLLITLIVFLSIITAAVSLTTFLCQKRPHLSLSILSAALAVGGVGGFYLIYKGVNEINLLEFNKITIAVKENPELLPVVNKMLKEKDKNIDGVDFVEIKHKIKKLKQTKQNK